MALYDYGNTRLRARISRLQSLQTLESFSDLTSIDRLISSLTKTPYKESIETALTYAHGYACIAEAMRREMESIVDDLNRFFQGDALEKVQVMFRRMDLLNIKTILRGLSHKASIEDVTGSFSPLGTIPTPILVQIAKSKDVYEAISRIAVYQLPVAEPLMVLKAKHTELNSSQIELALEKWYFTQIKEELKGVSEDIRILQEYYAIEADIVNLNTALRILDSSEGYKNLENEPLSFFVETGNIKYSMLCAIIRMKNVEQAIQLLFSMKYGKYLKKALDCYRDTSLLSEFENQMHVYAIKWLASLPRLYPLGIGVPMGYAALKKNEIRNLRWIAKGIQSGFEPAYIKENLESIL